MKINQNHRSIVPLFKEFWWCAREWTMRRVPNGTSRLQHLTTKGAVGKASHEKKNWKNMLVKMFFHLSFPTHRIHGNGISNMYLHLLDFSGNVGKYTMHGGAMTQDSKGSAFWAPKLSAGQDSHKQHRSLPHEMQVLPCTKRLDSSTDRRVK